MISFVAMFSFVLSYTDVKAEVTQNSTEILHIYDRETETDTMYYIPEIEKDFVHQPVIPSGSDLNTSGKKRTPGIIGSDDRWTVSDAGIFPYCAIARMTLYYSDISTYVYGTGFMVAPRLLATAGHVLLYEDSSGNIHFPTSITMEFRPYGSGTPYTVSSYRSIIYYGGYSGFDDNTDYGFVYLNEAIHSTTGHFGIRTACDDNQAIFAAGYPGSNRSALYIASGNVTSYTQDLLIHNADVEAGESGGPVYVLWEGLPYAMGVNSGMAYNSMTGEGIQNSSRLLNYSLYEWLVNNGYFN